MSEQRTINLGNETFTGEVVGFDPVSGDMHMKLSDGKHLLIRNKKTKVLTAEEVGPYLTREGYRLFQ